MFDIKEDMERFDMALWLRNYSAATRMKYIRVVREFLIIMNNVRHKLPGEINEIDILWYINLLLAWNITNRTINSYMSSIYWYFKFVLKTKINRYIIPSLYAEHPPPVLLSLSEFKRVLASIDDIKYKAMISFGYGSGLRISEIINLRIQSIDSTNMVVKVFRGKRGKDRYTVLSHESLNLARQYFKSCKQKPAIFLFPGNDKNGLTRPYQVRKAFKQALIKSGIGKTEVRFHSLRHSFATDLINAGYNLYDVRSLLGHSSANMTIEYVHRSPQDLNGFESPLDGLKKTL